MSYYPVRCTQCRKRRTLSKHPLDYVRTPRCSQCKGELRLDTHRITQHKDRHLGAQTPARCVIALQRPHGMAATCRTGPAVCPPASVTGCRFESTTTTLVIARARHIALAQPEEDRENRSLSAASASSNAGMAHGCASPPDRCAVPGDEAAPQGWPDRRGRPYRAAALALRLRPACAVELTDSRCRA